MKSSYFALAQINPIVGDFSYNTQLILKYVNQAAKKNTKFVVFGEMSLTGYPIEDLALQTDFLLKTEKELLNLANILAQNSLGNIAVIVGYPAIIPNRKNKNPKATNNVAVLQDGKIIATYSKQKLPNYGVFDEKRHFISGQTETVINIDNKKIALLVCEDIWQNTADIQKMFPTKVDMILVLNGSPYEHKKSEIRIKLITEHAKKLDTTIVYTNLVGAQDGIVFDGESFVASPNGKIVSKAKKFVEQLLIVDFANSSATTPKTISSPVEDIAEIYEALLLGLKDYAKKNHIQSVVLGLSGGIDSALVATLATDALGYKNVYGVFLPSKFSSQESQEDATLLAKNLKINYQTQSIKNFVNIFQKDLQLSGIAAENLQARIRAIILMGISNSEQRLLLCTSNKTELAIGYSTMYGDSIGGYAPIKDIPKSLVWELSLWRNNTNNFGQHKTPIPKRCITKPPSAELAPNQTDQDSLPSYEILDEILRLHIQEGYSAEKIVALGFEKETTHKIINLVKISEWKRHQSPPGTKIFKISFSKDRRFPITNF